MNTIYFRTAALSLGLVIGAGLATSAGQQPETPKSDAPVKTDPKDAKGAQSKAQVKNKAGARGPRQIPAEVVVTIGDPLKHWDVVRGIAHSPDGNWLATASDDGSVKVRNLKTGKESLSLKAGRNIRLSVAFYAVEFSPDSRLIAAASADKTIRIWDVATGEVKHVLAGHYDAVTGISFRPDGKALASSSDDRSVRIWDLENPKPHTGTPIVIPGVTEPIITPLAVFDSIGDFASAVAWSPNGRWISIGLWDKTTQIFDASTKQLLATLRGHGARISSLSFSGDSKTLASTALDGSVRLWETSSWNQRSEFVGHKGGTFVGKISPDGQSLATAGLDQKVRLWSATDGKQIREVTTHPSPVLAISWSPDGKTIASAGADAAVRFSDAVSESKTSQQSSPILSAAYSKNGNELITGDETGFLRLWDSKSGKELKTLPTAKSPLNAVATSRQGKLATGNETGKVFLWVDENTKPLELSAHKDAVRSLAFSPDGNTLFSGGADKAVHVWDATNGKLIRSLKGHDGSVTSIAFSPDGGTVITAADDRNIRVWETSDGRLVRTLDPDEDDDVLGIAIRPDGKQLISTGSREVPPTIKFWDPTNGAVQKLLPGHADRPLHAAYRPDGKFLATVAGDGTIRIWDPVGFKLVNTVAVRTPKGSISQVVFHPAGEHVATVNGNGTVTVVKLPDPTKAEPQPGQ